MFKEILVRIRQGHRTIRFPKGPPPVMMDKFKGRPEIDISKCDANCRLCADACPVNAIDPLAKTIDAGRCIFCNDCSGVCPHGALVFTKDYRLAVRERKDLLIAGDRNEMKLAAELDSRMKKLFGRSLKLRQVSAGGCNACEADINVLGTIGWDLGRFGIQFVASPRHADGLLITGPVTKNMEIALRKTYAAIADPKLVIVVGACAISGGIYSGHKETFDGVDQILPVDLYIPGCPPNPLTILDGLLRLLGKLEKSKAGRAGNSI